MNKISTLIFASFAAGCMLVSCDDSNEATDITLSGNVDAPQLTIESFTATKANCSWSAVEGVFQYGYKIVSATGEDVDGGVTNELTHLFNDLEPCTEYKVMVKAFANTLGVGESDYATASFTTPFYDAMPQTATSYTSYLRDARTTPYVAVITEDRSAADQEEDWYGVFTISDFMEKPGKDLKFKVNHNNTITILNGSGTNADGWVKVAAGWSSAMALNYIYIDEKSAVFDYKKAKLTFRASNNGSNANRIVSDKESITWRFPE